MPTPVDGNSSDDDSVVVVEEGTNDDDDDAGDNNDRDAEEDNGSKKTEVAAAVNAKKRRDKRKREEQQASDDDVDGGDDDEAPREEEEEAATGKQEAAAAPQEEQEEDEGGGGDDDEEEEDEKKDDDSAAAAAAAEAEAEKATADADAADASDAEAADKSEADAVLDMVAAAEAASAEKDDDDVQEEEEAEQQEQVEEEEEQRQQQQEEDNAADTPPDSSTAGGPHRLAVDPNWKPYSNATTAVNTGRYGRQLSRVRDYVICTVNKAGDGKMEQKCKYCDRTRNSTIFQSTQWAIHLIKHCPTCPEETKMDVLRTTHSADVQRAALSVGLIKPDDITKQPKQRQNKKKRQKTSKGSATNAGGGMPWSEGANDASTKTPTTGGGGRTTTSTAAAAAALKRSPYSTKYTNDVCDARRAKDISLKVMQFVAGTGQDLFLVQSPLFLELLRACNSEYVDKYLSKSPAFVRVWLPQLYESVQGRVQSMVEGWSLSPQPARLPGQNHNGRFYPPPLPAEQDIRRFMKRTVGLDGFVVRGGGGGSSAGRLLCVTEQVGDQVCCREIHMLDGDHRIARSSREMLDLGIGYMESCAQSVQRPIQDLFSSIILGPGSGDVKPSAVTYVQAKYPKLFLLPCRVRTGAALVGDILRIPEIDLLLTCDVAHVLEFVCVHDGVFIAYQRVAQNRGADPKAIAAAVTKQRQQQEQNGSHHNNLAGMYAMLEVLLDEKTQLALKDLISEELWELSTVRGIDNGDWVEQFMCLVLEEQFYKKVAALFKLIQPLHKFYQHLRCEGFCASWIMPLFEALNKDITKWCQDGSVGRQFGARTRLLVQQAFQKHWEEQQQDNAKKRSDAVTGFYSNPLLAACTMDAAFTPRQEDLPPHWFPAFSSLIKNFYAGTEYIHAEKQMLDLIVRRGGVWKEQVYKQQSEIEAKLDDAMRREQQQSANNTNNNSSSKRKWSAVEIMIQKQLITREMRRTNKRRVVAAAISGGQHFQAQDTQEWNTAPPGVYWWHHVFQSQFPLLHPIACRLLGMSTCASHLDHVVCADNDNSGGTNRFLPQQQREPQPSATTTATSMASTSTSTRLRLKLKHNKKVYQMLYCFVNLQLIHGCNTTGGGGATQSNTNMIRFLEQAILDQAATNDDDGDEGQNKNSNPAAAAGVATTTPGRTVVQELEL